MSTRLIGTSNPKRIKKRTDGGGSAHRGTKIDQSSAKPMRITEAPTRSGATSRLLGSGKMFARGR